MGLPLSRDDYDPLTIQLGLLSGLLIEKDGDPLQLEVDDGWFADPLAPEFARRRQAFFPGLLESLLGSATEARIKSTAEKGRRTWYPIEIPNHFLASEAAPNDTSSEAIASAAADVQALGLYLVTEVLDDESEREDLIVGFGIKPRLAALETEGIALDVSGYVPLFRARAGETGERERICKQ